MRRFWAVFVGTLLAGALARAEENRFAIQQLAIRGGVQAIAGDAGRTGAGTFTISYWGRNGLSGEGFVGRTLPGCGCGFWAGGAMRYGWVFGDDGAHAVGFGGGLTRWLHGPVGPMTFARAEAFYELRMREGFDLLLGAGPGWALTDGVPKDSSAGRAYSAGEGFLQGSAALGWSF